MDKSELKPIDDIWKEIELEEKEHPIRVFIRRTFYHIEDVYRDIKYFFTSHWFFLLHGYFPHSWWEFRTYEARRISKILKYFLENTNMDLKCSAQKEFGKALKEMVGGFEIIGKGDFEFSMPMKFKRKLCKKYKGQFSMKELLRQEKNYHKADRALKLFAKYYFWLWD